METRQRYDRVIQYAQTNQVNLSVACRALDLKRSTFAQWHLEAKRNGFAPDPSTLTAKTGPRFGPPLKRKKKLPTEDVTTVQLAPAKKSDDESAVTIISCKMKDIGSILKHLKH